MKKIMKLQISKTNNGITLIALVITIIILLILAGITIATLTGDNGLLNKANKAKEETAYANAEEKVKLALLEYQTKMKEETLHSILNKIEGLEGIEPDNEQDGPPYTVIVDGYIFEITKQLEIQIAGKVTGIKPKIIIAKRGSTANDYKKTEIIVEAQTEDKGGLKKIILEKDGILVMEKEVKGNHVDEIFEITENGTYKIKVIGENNRRESSNEIIINDLITINATLTKGTMVDGSVSLIVNASTGQGTIKKIEIYEDNSLIKDLSIDEKTNTVEIKNQVDNLPFCEKKKYYAQIVTSTNETKKTNVIEVENRTSIGTSTDLRKLSSLVNGGNTFAGNTVSLRNDIDLEKVLFTPIGEDTNEINVFQGEFDGNYYTIKNLKVENSLLGGLFGIIGENGKARNLYISDAEITYSNEGDYITNGILTATLYGQANRIGVSGVIDTYSKGYENYVGGLCGWVDSASIEECYSSAEIKVGKSERCDMAGGITSAATNGTSISNSYFDGSIIVKSPETYANIGGIAGAAWGSRRSIFY